MYFFQRGVVTTYKAVGISDHDEFSVCRQTCSVRDNFCCLSLDYFFIVLVLVCTCLPQFPRFLMVVLLLLSRFHQCKYSASGPVLVELPWCSWDAANLDSDFVCAAFAIFRGCQRRVRRFLGTLRLADRFTYGSQFWGALGLQRTFVFKIPLWFSTAVLPSALLWLGDPQNYCGDRRSDIDQPLCLFKKKHRRRASHAPALLNTQLQQQSLCLVTLSPFVVVFSGWC